MAGRLPGVGLPARKRVHLHQYEVQHDKYNREAYQKKWLELAPSPSASAATTMDETALKARQRLEQKLGYLGGSSSSETKKDHHYSCRPCESCKSSCSGKEGRDGKHSFIQKSSRYGGFGIITIGKSFLQHLGRHNRMRKGICAVCLEDFQSEQSIMKLACSHKYHRACLNPWLEAHPHCPYCRSPVQPAS